MSVLLGGVAVLLALVLAYALGRRGATRVHRRGHDRAPGITSGEPHPRAVRTRDAQRSELPEQLVLLAVATEWNSGHGGISTLNRELCVALAKLGHSVYCAVPRLDEREVAAALAAKVVLVAPEYVAGTSDAEALNRRLVGLPTSVHAVIGHGRITGGAALAQVQQQLDHEPLYAHFVHMDPRAIEWWKRADDPTRNAAREAQQRVDAEVEIGSHADVIIAVGPELRGAYANYFHHLQRSVHEFLPGLFRIEWNSPPSPDYRCLVFGRAEDRELKGVNFAADTMRLLCESRELRLAWLVIRGAPPGTEDKLHEELQARVGMKLRIDVLMYTSEREEILRTIRSASMVLMPSREEGFGLTGLEAITEGVPVLLSRTSGLAQALEARLPALADPHVVDIQDGPETVSTRIRDVLLQPEEAHRRVLELREAMRDVFNWERSAKDLVQLLRAAGSPDAQPPPVPPDAMKVNLATTFQHASSALLGWKQTLRANGEWLDRPELAALLAHARTKRAPLVLLGNPGTGKSALLARASRLLHDEGAAVLAIKADRLPRNIDTREKLASELGLPTDLATALRASAELRPTMLVIDQLDALGDLVDEQTQRLTVLLDLIEDLTHDGIVPVLMSCRSFDFRHDVRFQRLEAESIELQPPAETELDRVLLKSNVDPHKLPARFKGVLGTVQALDAFLQLKPADRALMETHQQLLNLLWKQLVGEGDKSKLLEAAARRIAIMMAEREELWLAWPVIAEADLQREAKTLVERGLLIEEGSRVAFVHQTLFDFARARAFLGEHSLAAYVRAKQGALFVRPTLWTSLGYLRAMDPTRYISELENLWLDGDHVRMHIHALLIQFAGQVPDPSDREVALLAPRLSHDIWRPVAVDAIAGRRPWFEILQGAHLPALMAGPHAPLVVGTLMYAYDFLPDDVVRLIKTYWMADATKHSLASRVVTYAKTWSEPIRELASTLIKAGSLDPHSAEEVIRTAIAVDPKFAPRLVQAELVRQRDAIADPEPKAGYKSLLREAGGLECLVDAASAAPPEFVEAVWPLHVDLIERVRSPGSPCRYGEDYGSGTSLRHIVREMAQAISDSIASWAAQAPDEIATFVATWQERDSVAVHRYLIMALEAGLPSTGSAALDYLLGDERRLNVGDSSPMDDYSVGLIRKLAPLLNTSDVERLQAAISVARLIDPSDREPEDVTHINEYNRRHRLRLLIALGKERIPDAAIAAVDEYEQKHLAEDTDDGVRGGLVGSALTVTEFLVMSDDEIVKFFADFPDSRGIRHPASDLIGGSVELSRAFGDAAKRLPDRFLPLLSRFKPGTTDNPVAYGLDAIAEVLPLARIEQAVLDLHGSGFFRTQDQQLHASYALERAARDDADMDQRVLDLLESWLVDDDSDVRDEDEGDEAGEGADNDGDDGDDDASPGEEKVQSLLWTPGGGGILPGGNYPMLYALTAGYLRRSEPKVDAWISVLERHLARRERSEVWNAMRRFLGDVLFAPSERAESFLERVFTQYPSVRDAHDGLIIIARAIHRLPSGTITRWIEALEAGDWSRRHQAAGELLALFATRHDAPAWARERIERELKHFEEARVDSSGFMLGVSFAAANLWREPNRRAYVTDTLVRIIRAGSGRVSSVAMDAFRMEGTLINDDATSQVLAALTLQPAVIASGRGLSFFEGLQDLLPDRAPEIADLLLGLVDYVKTQPDRSFLVPRGNQLVDISMTLQRLRSPIRERGLDLFERLMSMGLYEVGEVLSEIDPAERRGPPRKPRHSRRPRRRHGSPRA